jgi:nitroreductase
VTSDLRHFMNIGERNQGWIDGGMFSMQLLLALHAEGLGACPLNWSTDYKEDERFRAISVIPDHEIIMMFIAVGHLPDEFKIAQSARRPLSEILVKVE